MTWKEPRAQAFYGCRRPRSGTALELADLAAGGEVTVEGGEAQVALAVLRGKDHPLRLDAAQLHRLQVGDDDDLLALQVFRLVMLLDARDDLALLGAYLQLQDQQAVGLRVLFGVDHRRHAQLELREIVDGDLGLVLDCCLLGFLLYGFLSLRFCRHACLQLLDVDAGKERLAGFRFGAGRDGAPLAGSLDVQVDPVQSQLPQQLGALAGDDGGEQDGGAAQRLGAAGEYRVQPARLRLVLDEHPRLAVAYVLVRLAHGLHHGLHGPVEVEAVHLAVHPVRQSTEGFPQVIICRSPFAQTGDLAVAVAAQHAQGAVQQVAQVVGEVAVDALGQRQLTEGRVEPEGHVAHQEVAEGVDAVLVLQLERANDVALALAHLPLVGEPVAVHVQVPVDGQARRFQHGGPEHPVRLEDVLGDEVLHARPVALLEALRHQGRPVVDERVEPHVGDVVLVPGQGDAPGHPRARPRDGEVANRLAQYAQDLVPVPPGPDQIGVLRDVLLQPGAVLLHPEEVVLLAAVLGDDAMVGALAVDELLLGVVALAGNTVEAAVLAEVDVAGVVDALQDLLDDLLVAVLAGADEVVVADAQVFPDILEACGDLVGVLPRAHAGGLGCLLDLLAVLVGTREEVGVIAAQAVEAGYDVNQRGGVGVPQVRFGVHVEDWRGRVEHALPFLCRLLPGRCARAFHSGSSHIRFSGKSRCQKNRRRKHGALTQTSVQLN